MTAKQAMDRYNRKFCSVSYRRATKNRTNKYANELIDEALALCGHPAYTQSDRNWHSRARRFLALFA